MSDLKMKSWHIENLIELEPDAQVVLLVEAQEVLSKIEQDRDRLRVAGSYMSNVLYNLKQCKDIPEQDRALMAKWQAEWDRTVKAKEA